MHFWHDTRSRTGSILPWTEGEQNTMTQFNNVLYEKALYTEIENILSYENIDQYYIPFFM